MKRFNGELLVGLCLTGAVVLLALLSFFYTPYDSTAIDISVRNMSPSLRHPAGTDMLGRDILSRLMVGARFTLLVACVTVAVGVLIGSMLGLLCGSVGGLLDELVMRLVDAVNSFPGVLIALVVVTVLDYGNYTIILALCIMFIPSYTRIVRIGTLQYKEMEFVQHYRACGASTLRLLLVHIYPNLFPLLLPSIIIGLSNAILAESSMSYLGLGIQPPIPSWGWMLSEAQNTLAKTPWYAISTGVFIVMTIVGCNCLGEGLRQHFERRGL